MSRPLALRLGATYTSGMTTPQKVTSMKTIAFALFAAVLVANPVAAQSQKSGVPSLDDQSRKGDMARLAQKKVNDDFNLADEDNSGDLSRPEVAKHFPFREQNFERYDKNKDAKLSWEEFVGHDRWKREPKAN